MAAGREAAALLLGSSLMFALVGAGVKNLSGFLPNEVIVFLRSFAGLLVVTPLALRGGWRALRTRYLRRHLARALSGVAAMYCFFYAIGRLPLAEAMLLNYSSPLFIPFIARLWLREPIPPLVFSIVLVGFFGVAFILKPGLGFLSGATIVGLSSGFLTAVAMVSIRGLALEEPTERIVFYFGLVSTAVSALPLTWRWQAPPAAAWWVIAGIGAAAGAGQLCITRAYGLAPAARLGPFTYTTIVFAAVLGWAFWGEVPDRWSFLGAALVFLAGALSIRAMEPQVQKAPEEAIPEAGV